jgi:hypothetical protein
VLDWLCDNPHLVFPLLILASLVPFVVWWKTRSRKALYVLSAVAALAVLYAILWAVVETPRKQIERKLEEMAAAVGDRNADRIFSHIAEDFRLGSQDRGAFRGFVERALERGVVRELRVWEFEWPEGGDERTRPVEFFAKPLGGMAGEEQYYLVRATFVREADGQWRLKGFEIFNPFVESKQPLQIPQLP